MGRTPKPRVERFWEKVDVRGPNECWLWTAATTPQGYGKFSVGPNRWEGAHRVAYRLCVGPIPEGTEIDHVAARGCTSTGCVNPNHLEPVTHAVNVKRGRKATRTHCIHGHEFSPENTHIRGNGTRRCRTCDRIRHRDRAALSR